MGSCHSEISSSRKDAEQEYGDSQSTITSYEKPIARTHKTKEPFSEPDTKPEPGKELPLAFGKQVKKEFMLDPEYHNLNHGMLNIPTLH